MILEVKNLTYSYRNHKVLNKVSFDVKDSQLLCILGPNGAGKSTMFKCILQLLKDYKGEILLDNKNLKNYKIQELARKVAYIPQSHNPVFSYSVIEMVLMGTTSQISPMSKPSKEQIKIVEESLDKIGISYLKDRSFINLSGGERQLVLIARALAQRAKILVMDEPTSALDPISTLKVEELIEEMKEKFTVVIVTHNMQQAARISDKTAFFLSGDLVEFEDTKTVFTNPKDQRTEDYITGRFG